ncbi:hypothetical protein GE061_014683 [Apolygus lucorum]|uniref:Uncharacterized protein n=1 Tax=Apolygus lucorum TaxID=248454 RepID=A0A8S9XKY5_APOLU|nr:hypothetical protein GE061_014683 [Apolygus lucorum]
MWRPLGSGSVNYNDRVNLHTEIGSTPPLTVPETGTLSPAQLLDKRIQNMTGQLRTEGDHLHLSAEAAEQYSESTPYS